MRYLINRCIAAAFLTAVAGCGTEDNTPDAYGNFEAIEILVSAEGSGKIKELSIQEGDILVKDSIVGLIDTINLHLQKMVMEQKIKAIYTRLPDISSQVDILNKRLDNAKYEKDRFKRLVNAEAATTKQYDDITAQIKVLESEIIATRSSLTTTQMGLLGEVAPIRAQIDLLDDLIGRSMIKSPLSGTVLTQFAYQGELISQGRPLFKIADISSLICRAYISETQLSMIKIGEIVTVTLDNQIDGTKEYKGKITWVSAKSEFTPKVIQTRDERVSLVYAIKVVVANDGYLKIGMPAEIKF